MSRFWAAGSSSESESDDDSYSSSDSSTGPRQAENRWADLSDDSGKKNMRCCRSLMSVDE